MSNLFDEFNFLSSSTWLNYTQKRYLTLEETKYRLQQQGEGINQWNEDAIKISAYRKAGSVPLFVQSIEKRFWFYPSDCLFRKLDEIEKLGHLLFQQISQQTLFKEDFILNSTLEEAITSAIYEGAQSTRAQAQQFIASGSKPKNKDEWMLVNNLNAMIWVQGNRNKPITKDLVLELHRIVTLNTMEGDDVHFSGKFRNNKVFVGAHEGVPYHEIEQSVNEAIALTAHNPRVIHPLIRGILLHYFIAYIHPFFDGNGRTARALFYFKSMQSELEYVQILSVSAYLKEHGRQYEKAFEKVSQNDLDVTYFIDFCLNSIHSALLAVSRKVTYLLKINKLSEILEINANQVGLLQRMVLHKFRKISIEQYASQISMSREVARQELKSLLQLGMIQEIKEGKKLVYKINKVNLEKILSEN